MDRGHVHRVGINTIPYKIPRIFLKVTFTTDIFNRIGNDHNSLFKYQWHLYQRGQERNSSNMIEGYIYKNNYTYISPDKLIDSFKLNRKVTISLGKEIL